MDFQECLKIVAEKRKKGELINEYKPSEFETRKNALNEAYEGERYRVNRTLNSIKEWNSRIDKNKSLLSSQSPAEVIKGIRNIGDINSDGAFDDSDIEAARNNGYTDDIIAALQKNRQELAQVDKAIKQSKKEMEEERDYFKKSKGNESFLENLLTLGDSSAHQTSVDSRSRYAEIANSYYSLTVGDFDARRAKIKELKGELKNLPKKSEERKKIDQEIKQLKASMGELGAGDNIIEVANNIPGYIGDFAGVALTSANKALMATVDATLGNLTDFFGWKENNIFHENNKAATEYSNKAKSKLANEAYSAGDKYDIAVTLADAVGTTAPAIALLAATGGESMTVALAPQSTGTVMQFSDALCNMAKNPMYWTSFVQSFGLSYEEAKADNADEFGAYTYAFLNSAVNSAIEMGGVEALPADLRNVTKSGEKALLSWVKAGIEEGGEEIMQNAASNIIGTIAYGHDPTNGKSIGDNLNDTLKAGIYGTIGGLALGSANLTVDAALNAQTSTEYRAIGEAFLEGFSSKAYDFIAYAENSDNQDMRQLAETASRQSKSDSQTMGMLYSYAVRDINNAIDEAYDINSLNSIADGLKKENSKGSIRDIIASAYVRRLMELESASNKGIFGAAAADSKFENLEAEYSGGIEQAARAEGGASNTAEIGLEYNSNDGRLEGGARVIWDEPSVQMPQAELINDTAAWLNGNTPMSEGQRTVSGIAERLGLTVIFENLKAVEGENVDAYIDENDIIHIDYSCQRPLTAVFMHELTHYAEKSDYYASFYSAAVKSRVFDNWLKSALPDINGGAYKTEELVDIYVDKIREKYENNGVALTASEARNEMTAEFVAETMFNEGCGEAIDDILSGVNQREHGRIVQFLIDFVRYIKERLQGNNKITFELMRLEGYYKRALNNARVQAEENTNVKYAFAGVNAKTADLAALEEAKRRADAGENREKIRKETGWHIGGDLEWRFETDESEMTILKSKLLKAKTVGEVVKKCELIKAYPQLADIAFEVDKSLDRRYLGIYDYETNTLKLARWLVDDALEGDKNRKFYIDMFLAAEELEPYQEKLSGIYNESDLASVQSTVKEAVKTESGRDWYNAVCVDYFGDIKDNLIHELQHIVQEIEGFAEGTSSAWEQMRYDQGVRIRDEDGNILTPYEMYYTNKGEREARDAAARRRFSEQERKKLTPDMAQTKNSFSIKYVKRYSINEVPDNSTIKQQLRKNADSINQAEQVCSIEAEVAENKLAARQRALEEFKKFNYSIQRKNFGIIEFGKAKIGKALNYLNTPEELTAIVAVPYVLKKGELIDMHKNHKGRNYSSATIAARVRINGTDGIMGIVVKLTGKNNYYTHRILMPDGSEFVFEKQDEAEPTAADMNGKNTVQGNAIGSVSGKAAYKQEGSAENNYSADENNYSKSSEDAFEKYFQQFIESPYYSSLNTSERRRVIKQISDFSAAQTSGDIFSPLYENDYKAALEYEKRGDLIPYFVSRAIEC